VSGTVLVVGSVNADLVVAVERLPQPGETVTGGRFSRHGGGKGANQAVAAARAGARVRFVGAVGDDDLGDAALRQLADEGIDVTGVVRLAGEPTGVALISVDERGRNQITVASGANARVDARVVEAALKDSPPAAGDVCLLSFEIPDDALIAAARAASAAGARVVLNPAPARSLVADLAAAGPVLTPNAIEAATLGGADDPADAARALTGLTGAPVVVTVGEEGAIVATGDRLLRIPSPPVEVVDTTGAGDTFSGVLAAAIAEGLDLEAAARRAVMAASASVRARGARAGMPRREELEALSRERVRG
jgi:ribokinase